MKIPENLTDKALFNWLIQNKSMLVAAKKAALKEADGFPTLYVNKNGDIVKADASDLDADVTKLDAQLIINTTNYFDSHSDVHIPGLWKKSLNDTVDHYLCKEHVMSFENIISENIKAYTKKFSWKDLGYNANGVTEALVFDAVIEKDRHPFMFNQYKKGYVKNHSVGMRYVKIFLAINDEDYKEEFSTWNTYVDDIINRADAEASGYFWAITEAKVVEGSAVVRGSNKITPVYSIQSSKQSSTAKQPPEGTEKQPQSTPDDSTAEKVQAIDWEKLATVL